MNITMKIESVDHNGFNGREHHPTDEMVGRYVHIVKMETVAVMSFEDDELTECSLCALPNGEHEYDCPNREEDESYKVFYGLLVNADGSISKTPVELMEHEVVSEQDIPVLFTDMEVKGGL